MILDTPTWRAILEQPDVPLLYLRYADELTVAAYTSALPVVERSLSVTFQWLGGRRKHPLRLEPGTHSNWLWFNDLADVGNSRLARMRDESEHAVLPKEFFLLGMRRTGGFYQAYRNLEEAFRALHESLWAVRSLVCVPGDRAYA